QLDQLATLARVEATRGAVRARLDADDVRALAEHAPDEVVRELVAAEHLVGTEAETAVHDPDRHAAVTLGGELMLEDLLDEPGRRRFEGPVALRRVVAARLDGGGGYEQLRP